MGKIGETKKGEEGRGKGRKKIAEERRGKSDKQEEKVKREKSRFCQGSNPHARSIEYEVKERG